MDWPQIIQGGMGVGVSSWQLAAETSRLGALGVVSGTAVDLTVARRLQDGDQGGHVRRALAAFPRQDIAEQIIGHYYRPEGRRAGRPYRAVPKPVVDPCADDLDLTVAAAFVEVYLAKEGHTGQVGVNLLEKIQLATPAAVLGSMLAGVDAILMGAGVPRQIPRLIADLAAGRPGGIDVDVTGATDRIRTEIDPARYTDRPLASPRFFAIVSATVLAAYLARDESTRPDAFVVEGPLAGGHNAPPRGALQLDDQGEPIYGPRDDVDLVKLAALGLPFYLAGSYGTPERLAEALAVGAAGIQVGTLFALADESGIPSPLRKAVISGLANKSLAVATDVSASPTGFPFKVARLPGTLATAEVYHDRQRICDLGYLREVYVTDAGNIGYRCPSEPVEDYVAAGGDPAATEGRVCLCNALTSTVGLAQIRPGFRVEPALVTLGQDTSGLDDLIVRYPDGWTAAQAMSYLTEGWMDSVETIGSVDDDMALA